MSDFRLILDLEACRADILAAAGWEPTTQAQMFQCESCGVEFDITVPHIHGKTIEQESRRWVEAFCSEGCAIKAMVEA